MADEDVKKRERLPVPNVGGIVLPFEPQEAVKLVPETMLLYGLPKCGKTTALAELPNHLIIDVERKSDFVKCNRIQPPVGIKPVALFEWLKQVAKAIEDAGRPYDYVVIDTASLIDEASEWKGTFDYMDSPQGRGFNRVDGKGSPALKPTDPGYDSVHSIGDGYGYRYSRKAMTDFYDMFKNISKVCTIFVCHVKDKIITTKAGVEVLTMDISLTGKVKNIFTRDVDAIAYVYFKGGKLNISFNGNEDKLGGMRGTKHLQGFSGPLDWNHIFLLNGDKETEELVKN